MPDDHLHNSNGNHKRVRRNTKETRLKMSGAGHTTTTSNNDPDPERSTASDVPSFDDDDDLHHKTTTTTTTLTFTDQTNVMHEFLTSCSP